MITCDIDVRQLFEKSLAAELKKRPHLVELTPKTLKPKDTPGLYFRARLSGYFVAPKLCRLYVLAAIDAAVARGEPFVKWVDPLDPNSSHDGSKTLAHFISFFYADMHDPEMSVICDRDGAVKSTGDAIRKVQAYIWAHRNVLARRCNDMLKQKYGMKKHAKVAWAPLQRWLYSDKTLTSYRVDRLVNFNKLDKDLFRVVGECLLNLANGDNRPWGVAAMKPTGYSAVPAKHKVSMTEYSIGLHVFFYSFSFR